MVSVVSQSNKIQLCRTVLYSLTGYNFNPVKAWDYQGTSILYLDGYCPELNLAVDYMLDLDMNLVYRREQECLRKGIRFLTISWSDPRSTEESIRRSLGSLGMAHVVSH